MNKTAVAVFWAVVLVTIAVIAWFQWPRTPAPPPPSDPVAEAPAEPPASAPAEPEVKYPIESASAPAVSPPFSGDVNASLIELLGREAVLTYLQSDDFARRFVATVDNLGREQAPTRLWPVNPTPGRFTVSGGDAKQIAAANAARYEPFVRRFGRLDASRAVAWYLSAYPQLEKAYIELGYPRGHFNDRLVQVIDRLLATPEVVGPLPVRLTDVKGPVKTTQPWVRYEFTDARYESLSSGQKMLLRMGPDHARLLKAKLQEIRQLIAKS